MAAGRYRKSEPCVVEDCPNTIDRTNLGICEAHYYRLRRDGKLGSVPPRPRGTPYPACIGPDCQRPGDRGYGMCDLHYQRYRKHGAADVVLPAPSGPASPNWAGNSVTYGGAHQRVRSVRGPASAHPCSMTGCTREAAQWSFLREDAALMPYSPDPYRYRPLCVPCHKRYDLHALQRESMPLL